MVRDAVCVIKADQSFFLMNCNKLITNELFPEFLKAVQS